MTKTLQIFKIYKITYFIAIKIKNINKYKIKH